MDVSLLLWYRNSNKLILFSLVFQRIHSYLDSNFFTLSNPLGWFSFKILTTWCGIHPVSQRLRPRVSIKNSNVRGPNFPLLFNSQTIWSRYLNITLIILNSSDSFEEYLSVFRTVINFPNRPVFTVASFLTFSFFGRFQAHDCKHTAMHTGSSLSRASRRVKLPPTRRLWQYAGRTFRIHAGGYWTDWLGVFRSVQKAPSRKCTRRKAGGP